MLSYCWLSIVSFFFSCFVLSGACIVDFNTFPCYTDVRMQLILLKAGLLLALGGLFVCFLIGDRTSEEEALVRNGTGENGKSS